MTIYHLNIAGQSWDAFAAADDDDAMVRACDLLAAGPHGDPADGPTTIRAGIFGPGDDYIGEVEVKCA